MTAAYGVCVSQGNNISNTYVNWFSNNNEGLYSGSVTVNPGISDVNLCIGYYDNNNVYQLYGQIIWPVCGSGTSKMGIKPFFRNYVLPTLK